MKIVIDTNVLLSSFLTDGLAKRVFDLCIDNDEIYLSEWIFNGLKTKLENKFHVPEAEITHLIRFLKQISKIIEPKGSLYKESRDIKDNPILLLADNVKADLILTGDKDLLELINYNNTKIINPRTYYELYR
jgi:uncharacterized protein